MHCAPLTAGAPLRVHNDRMAVFVRLKHLVGTKSNAQAAILAPVGKDSHPCAFSPFLLPLLRSRFLQGLNGLNHFPFDQRPASYQRASLPGRPEFGSLRNDFTTSLPPVKDQQGRAPCSVARKKTGPFMAGSVEIHQEEVDEGQLSRRRATAAIGNHPTSRGRPFLPDGLPPIPTATCVPKRTARGRSQLGHSLLHLR